MCAHVALIFSRHPPHWRDDYPLHRHAMIGNAEGILRLLGEGYLVTQRDKDSNTPIHLAARYFISIIIVDHHRLYVHFWDGY